MARRRGAKGEINIFGNAAFMDAMANTIGALVFMLLMVVVVTVALKLNLFPLEVRTKALPDAVVGKPYDVVLASVGGNQPYTWERVKGTLPEGLTVDLEPYKSVEMQNGKIKTGNIAHVRGVPKEETATGPATFLMKVVDTPVLDEKTGKRSSERMSAQAEFQLTVRPGVYKPQPLKIKTSTLPVAIVGKEYAVYLAAAGGAPPYEWSLEGDAPGDIVRLDAAEGKLFGKPAREGEWHLTLVVKDSAKGVAKSGAVVFKARPFIDGQEICCGGDHLLPTLQITTTALPLALANRTYDVTLAAVGGVPPYAWTVSKHPPDMQVTPDGHLTWKPTRGGADVSLTVSVTSSAKATTQETDTKALTLKVENEPGKVVPLKMF